MGREVKRVALDFDWPIGKIWYGYMLNKCLCDSEIYKNVTCEDCRNFARLKNIKLTSYNCPSDFLGPPIGEGWQMWETTSEGSPMSPVFKTPEELAKWLFDTRASTFGCSTASYETWLKMITVGYAPTMVVTDGKIESGVESIANKE